MKSSFVQFLSFIVACSVISGASATESANAIDIGLGGLNPMPHCDVLISMLDYQRRIMPKTLLIVQGSLGRYQYDDGKFLEKNTIKGVDLGARYYPDVELRGFFWGGAIGYWNENREFTQGQNTASQWQGKANNNAFRLNIDVGYSIPIQNRNISIIPVVSIGKFFFPSSCEITAPTTQIGNTCNERPEANYYIFAGVSTGIAF